MNTWTFDLTTETDPVRRLGLHGLYRLLAFGENHESMDYRVVRSDTLDWEITETSVTIHWATPADLNHLMSQMVGDFSDGFAVSPGYPTDRNDIGIYATILAHKGITQHFFAKAGACRSRSDAVGGKGGEDKVSPQEAIGSTEEKPKQWELSFTRHHLHTEPPYLSISDKKKTFGQLDKAQGLGYIYHPLLAQWNMKDQSSSPETKFLASFSCLAHIFIWDTAASFPFGLGIDAPTFELAADYHDLWIQSPVVYSPGENACAWSIATAVNLPAGTYVKVSATGASYFNISENDKFRLYPILRNGMAARTGARSAKELTDTIVEYRGEAFEVILRNVRLGRAWYTEAIPTYDPRYNSPYKWSSIKTLYTNIFTHMAEPMEQAVSASMASIMNVLAQKYSKRFGSDLKSSYERARRFVINVNLNRAHNRNALLKSLANITHEAGRGFSEDEMNWILARSETRHSEVRSLLILACTTFRQSKTQPETSTS